MSRTTTLRVTSVEHKVEWNYQHTAKIDRLLVWGRIVETGREWKVLFLDGKTEAYWTRARAGSTNPWRSQGLDTWTRRFCDRAYSAAMEHESLTTCRQARVRYAEKTLADAAVRMAEAGDGNIEEILRLARTVKKARDDAGKEA